MKGKKKTKMSLFILFILFRLCEPYHGFVILSTVSRETFVQIIKACMEFKHSPTYEAFLQYKVDVGGIELKKKSFYFFFLLNEISMEYGLFQKMIVRV
jgi:hypothetical protein